jgi:hypothetical protein
MGGRDTTGKTPVTTARDSGASGDGEHSINVNLTPNQAQWLTLGFVIAMSAIVIGYDVLIIRAYGVDASISRVLRRLFATSPVFWAAFVFWLGVMVGHFGLPSE